MLPSFFLSFVNWRDAVQFKQQVAAFRHMVGFIAIARDRDTGRVVADPVDGKPRIQYTPSAFDRRHALQGALELCRIARATEAEEIQVAIANVPNFHCKKGSTVEEEAAESARFEDWLQTIEKTANANWNGTLFLSAHQMGTCRMSASPKKGVVDPQGRVWGVKDLYVADMSVFPSASGVNPMVTGMAICQWISEGLVAELEGEKIGGVRASKL